MTSFLQNYSPLHFPGILHSSSKTAGERAQNEASEVEFHLSSVSKSSSLLSVKPKEMKAKYEAAQLKAKQAEERIKEQVKQQELQR